MGTDIHGVLQEGIGDKWYSVGGIEDSRNYRVFAALADVRNGTGFAGVPTHIPITPISEPRGIPTDFDQKEAWNVLNNYADFDEKEDGDSYDYMLGDHSLSWLSVQEAVTWWGWDQPLFACGYISREQYGLWDHESPPAGGWSGGISGPRIVTTEVGQIPPDNWTHVRVGWATPLRDACATFIKWLEYADSRCGSAGGRIVFGFDS